MPSDHSSPTPIDERHSTGPESKIAPADFSGDLEQEEDEVAGLLVDQNVEALADGDTSMPRAGLDQPVAFDVAANATAVDTEGTDAHNKDTDHADQMAGLLVDQNVEALADGDTSMSRAGLDQTIAFEEDPTPAAADTKDSEDSEDSDELGPEDYLTSSAALATVTVEIDSLMEQLRAALHSDQSQEKLRQTMIALKAPFVR